MDKRATGKEVKSGFDSDWWVCVQSQSRARKRNHSDRPLLFRASNDLETDEHYMVHNFLTLAHKQITALLNLDPEEVSFITRPKFFSQAIIVRGRLVVKKAHQSSAPGMYPTSIQSSILGDEVPHRWPSHFLNGWRGPFSTSLSPTARLLCPIVKDIQNGGLPHSVPFTTVFQFSLKRVSSQQCHGKCLHVWYCCLLKPQPLPRIS